MKTRTAAIVLAAVLTAPAFAAEPAQTAKTTQASEAATTFCKLSATIAHDAVLARLNGEKREQAEKRLLKRFMPAAKHVKAREMVQETVTRLTGSIYQSKLNPNLEKSDYKYIAEEVGKGEFQLCMEAAMSN
jgi:acid shock protein